jgi:hypothetical protein
MGCARPIAAAPKPLTAGPREAASRRGRNTDSTGAVGDKATAMRATA